MNSGVEGIAVGRRRNRQRLARARLAPARESLRRCRLCGHVCGVDRTVGQLGVCRAGSAARIFSAQVEVGDELELVPTFAIALSGCDFRCDFCITGAESWNPKAGVALTPRDLAERAASALDSGARTVMVLGGEPTVHLPWVMELVSELPAEATLVWKTNGHGSPEARALLEGLFDVWVVDYKFGNDTCARRLARVPDYTRLVRENLTWAAERTDVIVRHLLMPGHIECCWLPVARWLAIELPGVKVSLRDAFWPGWRCDRHPELLGSIGPKDTTRARHLGLDLGLRLVS